LEHEYLVDKKSGKGQVKDYGENYLWILKQEILFGSF
jgi:hypothetical protein